ncbi:Rieske 2Fe-2S domain-containing protein [Streptomyces sp. NPDC001351]|uniref:Rieske 2Fe-2S domain-containing protein n=1 Tax=Streptomyces sp. NPDC001351 TaxID=3364564 RepID=UPI0036A47461
MTIQNSAPVTGTDTGTGYGRPRPSHDARLTEVGPGTPMGEALRRYWHPVANSGALTSEVPHCTRVLGEDLIVFRDGAGRAGVVFERCAHRGSSLYYGRIEEDGIRCCYHGWKFDVQGHCLEQACEPGRGRRRDVARQPWYPVEERYGLVFVYMGPPERKPPLPRYDFFEELEEGEAIYAEIPVPGQDVTGMFTDFNWLQGFENALDAVHPMWLHYHHSGPQFDMTGTPDGLPHSFFDPDTAPAKIRYERTERGAMTGQRFERKEPDGTTAEVEMVVEVQVPTIIALPDTAWAHPGRRHDCLIWVVPSDDTTTRAFIVVRGKDIERVLHVVTGIRQNGKLYFELTEEEKQRFPGDFEAQGSQGPITLHSEETLASADKGIVMLRRMLRQAVDDVEAGRDPQNAHPDDNAPRSTPAGFFDVSTKAAGALAEAGTAPSADS